MRFLLEYRHDPLKQIYTFGAAYSEDLNPRETLTTKHDEVATSLPRFENPSTMNAEGVRDLLAKLQTSTIEKIFDYQYSFTDFVNIHVYLFESDISGIMVSLFLNPEPLFEPRAEMPPDGPAESALVFRLDTPTTVGTKTNNPLLPTHVARLGQLVMCPRGGSEDHYEYTNWELYVDVESKDLAVWALGAPILEPWDPNEEEGTVFYDFDGCHGCLVNDDVHVDGVRVKQNRDGVKKANGEAVVRPNLTGFLADDAAGKVALFLPSIHDLAMYEGPKLAKQTFDSLRTSVRHVEPYLVLIPEVEGDNLLYGKKP